MDTDWERVYEEMEWSRERPELDRLRKIEVQLKAVRRICERLSHTPTAQAILCMLETLEEE